MIKNKKLTAAKTALRDPEIWSEYFEMQKEMDNSDVKIALSEKHSISIAAIQKVLQKMRKQMRTNRKNIIQSTN
jgi:hypothetical protein